MVVTLFGMLRVVSLEQSAKALQSINVTLLGMLMEVNPLHPLKQSELIFSMPSGRVIDVNELQPAKAQDPIVVTLSESPTTDFGYGIRKCDGG